MKSAHHKDYSILSREVIIGNLLFQKTVNAHSNLKSSATEEVSDEKSDGDKENLEEILNFINTPTPQPAAANVDISSKASKRARQKQKVSSLCWFVFSLVNL